MNYTKIEIKEYTKILKYFNNYNKVIKEYTKILNSFNNEITYKEILNYFTRKVKCVNCQKSAFTKIRGYYWCRNCGYGLGHYIGNFEKRDYERTIYCKKSVYQREYHYKNKVEEIDKKFNLSLSSEEKYEIYCLLMKIDNKVMEKMNKKFKRKRLINIYFLIKKFTNNDKIILNLSKETLEFYNKWYDYYLYIKQK